MNRKSIIVVVAAVAVLALVFVFGFSSERGGFGGGGVEAPDATDATDVTFEEVDFEAGKVVVPDEESRAGSGTAVPESVEAYEPDFPLDTDAGVRTFSINANNGKFEPSRIIVYMDDIVVINLTAEDAAYDLFLPDIVWRSPTANPGAPVRAELQASLEPGKYQLVCDVCEGKKPSIELIIAPRP